MVLVFKTNVVSEASVQLLRPKLNQLLFPLFRWNFDLEDCDCILRVEGVEVSPRDVMGLLSGEGFWCEELE